MEAVDTVAIVRSAADPTAFLSCAAGTGHYNHLSGSRKTAPARSNAFEWRQVRWHVGRCDPTRGNHLFQAQEAKSS